MESQFGIAHVWTQGDFVTKGVAIILLVMSVASWLVIILKALDIVKFKKFATQAQDFWHSADLATGLEKLGDDKQNPFRFMVLEGREASAHHADIRVQGRMQRGERGRATGGVGRDDRLDAAAVLPDCSQIGCEIVVLH